VKLEQGKQALLHGQQLSVDSLTLSLSALKTLLDIVKGPLSTRSWKSSTIPISRPSHALSSIISKGSSSMLILVHASQITSYRLS